MLVAILLCGAGSAWGDEVVILPSDGTAISSADYTITKSPINVTVVGSTLTSDQIRIFKNKTITISSVSATITGIEFTCTANGTSQYGPGCFAALDGYSYSGKIGTWSGNSSSVTFTAETNQVRATQIKVTYSQASDQVAMPDITGAENFVESSEVSITCSTEGATIQYSTNNGTTWTTYNAPFTVTETTTVQAKATKTGLDDSAIASKTFTKHDVKTIAQLNTQTANGTYFVNFQNAVVTYVNGSNCYIEDATGAILYFKTDNGRTAGETVNGIAEVILNIYNGLPEITLIKGVVFQTGSTTLAPTVVTLAELTANYTSYLSKYIKIENATVTSALENKNATIEQNGTSMAIRQNGNAEITKLTAGANINLIAFPTVFNGVQQLSVYNDDQIEAKQENIITVKATVMGPGRTTEGNVFEIDRLNQNPIEESLVFLSTCSASTDVSYIQYTVDTEQTTIPSSEYELAEGDRVLIFKGNTTGTIVVKAFAPGNDQYRDGEATITVNISGISRDGYITVDQENITMNSTDTQSSTVVALLSLNTDVVPGDNIKFYAADGETAATYDWINAQLILDGAQYKVTISTTANQSSDARTAYLKVYVYDGDYDVYSPLITVTQRGVVSGEVVDEITKATTGVTGTSYQEWSGKRATSDAVYAGQSAGGNDAIQLRSSNNNSGIVTTTSGGVVQSVEVEWNENTSAERTINIYGSHTAYTAATDLYDESTQGTLLGTIVYGTSTTLTLDGDYEYIGIRSANSALYLDKIIITWSTNPKQAAGLAYETASYNVILGDEFTAPTLANPNNLAVTYESSDPTVATVDEDGAVAILAVGTTTITASSAETDTYKAGQASYTITVNATALANIAALTAETDAGDYNVTFADAVVTYVNGKYAYIQDASGAVAMYKDGHGLTAGQILNGTATVTYQVRNGNPQITVLSGVTATDGTAPEPVEIAAAEWNTPIASVLSQYFKVTGATLTQDGTKYYVQLGDESVQLYKIGSAPSISDLSVTYSIVGFPTLYNTTKELQIFVDPVAETEPRVDVAEITGLSPQQVFVGTTGEFTLTATFAEGLVEGDDYEISWTSSDQSVLELADEVFEAKAAGTVNVTVHISASDDTRYIDVEKTFQVTVLAPNFAELPFEFDGGRADVETTDGLTQEGLDSDYGSSPKLKFNGTGDYVLLAFNEQPGTLTFDIKGNTFSGGTFTVQTSEDGVTFTDLKSYTELGDTQSEEFDNLGENVRYIKWVYTEKSSGNVALGNIKLGSANPNEPVISASNITLASSATSGEIPYTITNPVAGQSLTATTAAEWISDIVVGEEAITFTTTENQGDEDRSAVFTLTYQGADTKTVTVTQSRFVIDFATLPFAWEGGSSEGLLALDGVTANGLGTDYADGHAPYLVKLDGTGDYIQVKTNERPGVVTIGVKMAGGASTSTITVQESADGETFTDVQALTISGAQNDILNLSTTTEFAESSRYVRLLFTKGSNVGVGPITIAQYEDIVLEDYTLSIAESEIVTITANYGEEVLTNGENADITQGTEITLAITPAEGYDLASLTITGAEEGQSVTPVASSTTAGVYTFTMPAFAVTVTATVVEHVEPVLATYVLATRVTSGKRYVIASGTTEGTIQVMGNQANNNRPAVGATLDADGKLSVSDEYEFVIESATIGEATGYSIFDEGDNGYLYAAGSNNNYLRTQETNDVNSLWTITIGEGGVASIVAEESSNRNVMRYNNSSTLFSCYEAGKQSPVYLYEKVETPPASKGDVNNDGNVTIADVTALVNIILGKDTEGVYDHEVADVNDDGHITIADVTALVNIILGKNQN